MIAIEKDVPLAPHTSFRIGGPARYFVAVSSAEELRHALVFAMEKGLSYRVLGGGTNLLVNDSGFPGLIIKAGLKGIQVDDTAIEADAGVELMQLVQCASAHGLTGIESLAGIPGTVGGAVRGNAGAYGTSIGEVVANVLALDTNEVEFALLTQEECAFNYRSSNFKRRSGLVVVRTRLNLARGVRHEIERKVEETIAKRLAKNLQAERSVGSFFMNPVIRDEKLIEAFERERGVRCRDNRIPAGWFIDRAGLRNRRMGGAVVSEKHANYILNTGNALASDVVSLAAAIKAEVLERMGVELQEEVCYLGF